ncbi:alpha/beta fold hydrolase [Streptomyces sp. BBFR2]|uniref:alpha/beta fold hydrolase n=1 Tax=Streptomyces sp. BBFR2 TaxID=3372854 RepID=UPI0037DA7687
MNAPRSSPRPPRRRRTRRRHRLVRCPCAASASSTGSSVRRRWRAAAPAPPPRRSRGQLGPRVIDGLAARCRVITFDLRGVGTSGGSTPDSIEAMARDAVRFIRALGFEQVRCRHGSPPSWTRRSR